MQSYKNLFSLSGRIAVVTGGAGILGSHFCAGLAEHGADIAVVDLHEEAADALAASLIERYGVSAIGVGCDVSNSAAVEAMAIRVEETLGPIDVLHNNAASKSENLEAFFASSENYDLEEWRKVMAVNLDGMFLVARTVGKRMMERGSGSIVQTASIYGLVGPDKRIYEGSHYLGREINTPAVYAVSKGGVVAFTRYLASMWAEHGIRVNTLTPGGVQSGQNETFKSKYSARVPLGRMAQPHEMVGALVYLASDASSYVTGQNIIVDGGWTAW